MIDFRESDIEKLVTIAINAGEIINSYFRKRDAFSVENKIDDSPVTTADLKASEYILKELENKFPNLPSLSEESPKEHFDKRREWKTFFLIDPLDGTKEFIKGSGEFTVNIALIDAGVVVAGVVHLPVLGDSYYGSNKGSYLLRKGDRLRLPLVSYTPDTLNVVSSKSHKNENTDIFLSDLKNHYKEVNSLTFGSSLKLCKVAEGIADMNPRLGLGTKEWDIAAGHAVILGAGGDILSLKERKQVQYNKESLLNPEYIALRSELLDHEG